MTHLDLEFVRKQFPAFSEPSLKDFAHFENAGGSYSCRQTIEWLERYYRQTKVQPYYPAAPSKLAGEQMDRARERMAAWLNVRPDELHFGPSTSQNSYVIARALHQSLQPGDEIIVTNQDHEANVGVWRRLESAGIVIREWQVDPKTAELNADGLDRLLTSRTRVVAFTHCSNVVGTIHPVRDWTDRIHAAGARAIVDGVAFCPHGLPNLAELGADVYFFSLYKFYGPHLGALYVRDDFAQKLPHQSHFFNESKSATRFTPAGPDHAQIAAVNGVIDYLDEVAARHGFHGTPVESRAAAVRNLFRTHETTLLQPLLDYLANHAQVRLIGRHTAVRRAPTVAFTVRGRDPLALARELAAANLGLGVGHFYAYRLVKALGIDTREGVLRASFVHYTSSEEVTRLIEALDDLLQ